MTLAKVKAKALTNGISHENHAHIRHQCRKTIVLGCHRCLINTGFKQWTTLKYRLELWPPEVSK